MSEVMMLTVPVVVVVVLVTLLSMTLSLSLSLSSLSSLKRCGLLCFKRPLTLSLHRYASSRPISSSDSSSSSSSKKVGNQIALSFYQFIAISEPDDVVQRLRDALKGLDIKGTLLVATEGYNGQFIVPVNDVDMFHRTIVSSHPSTFTHLDFNLGNVYNFDHDDDSSDDSSVNVIKNVPFPFKKLIVRSKANILTDGLPPAKKERIIDWNDAGPELDASTWHEQISSIDKLEEGDDRKPLLLDCRNAYENDMGTFSGSTPLPTTVFSESWDVLDRLLQDQPKDKKILTFCTGGIRCVKVNAYIKQKGFNNIGRLKHGIIGYERWINQSEHAASSKFKGKNFLFDRRRLTETTDNVTDQS